MADADYDGFGGGYPSTDLGDGIEGARRWTNLAGAACSVALVIGLGLWGYKLALRDVAGVPVIRALDGPMRIAPENPGGEVADNQGLSVNEVAAVGVVAAMPDKLILAPRPVALAADDAAGLSGLDQTVAVAAAPAVAARFGPELALAAVPVQESASPTEIAVAAALAEALGIEVVPDVATAVAADDPAAIALAPEDVGLADITAPEGAIIRSPRPMSRPANAEAAALGPVTADTGEVVEVDPATLPPGTRLVQFGAYDTKELARAEWVRLQGQFGDLMADKSMVIQAAESGGRTFFRLRAEGYADEADARRFCSAMLSESATCIPVALR